MKKIYLLLLLLSLFSYKGMAKLSVKALTQEERTAMLNEAEDFIDELNDGRQDRQSDAIYHAIHGQGNELMKLRESRNFMPELSESVERKDFYGDGASRGVAMRLYKPVNPKVKTLPTLVYFHGGGWTIGGINSCAHFCDALAATGNVAVLAVDYSLAPEKTYPQGLLDCVSSLEYALGHAKDWGSSAEKVSIGGDSSGGNLALSTVLYANDDKTLKNKIRSVVLFYPVLKAYPDGSESWKRYSKGYGLDARLMEAFNLAYVAGGDKDDPLVSPAKATDERLRALPPLLFIGAGRDILFDQGKEFYERVSNLGNSINWIPFNDAVHLFITVPGQTTAFQRAVYLTEAFLK